MYVCTMLICRFKTTNLNEHKEEHDDAVDFLKLIWLRDRLACVHTKKVEKRGFY